MKTIVVKLKDKEESAVKGAEVYNWFKYTGKRATIIGQKKKVEISPGDIFGLRASSNGKESRLVTKKDGLTKVYTLAEIETIRLNKYSAKVKAPKLEVKAPATKVVNPKVQSNKEAKAARNAELDAAIKWYASKHGGGQGPMATPDQIIAKWKKAGAPIMPDKKVVTTAPAKPAKVLKPAVEEKPTSKEDAKYKATTAKALGLSIQELDALVKKRLKEGWEWKKFYTSRLLSPPKDDKRNKWAANFLPYSEGLSIPHWIARKK